MGATPSLPKTASYQITKRDVTGAVVSMQGWRKEMEDAHILEFLDDPHETVLFAVFDGHHGGDASKYAEHTYLDLLRSIPEFQTGNQSDLEKALKDSFLLLDEKLRNAEECEKILKDLREFRPQHDHNPDWSWVQSGTTAIVGVLRGLTLTVANAGDSRGILSRKVGKTIVLSKDHRAEDPEETTRVLAAGANLELGRVNGLLHPTRAIGDFLFKSNPERTVKEQAVIALPDVKKFNLTSDDQLIVLACDGVWDVETNASVANYLCRKLHLPNAGRPPPHSFRFLGGDRSNDSSLVKAVESLMEYCASDFHGHPRSKDNLTCVALQLSQEYFNVCRA